MKLSKGHYEIIADALADLSCQLEAEAGVNAVTPTEQLHKTYMLAQTIEKFCKVFERNNSNFKKHLFVKRCSRFMTEEQKEICVK